jgi:hypothetical protein
LRVGNTTGKMMKMQFVSKTVLAAAAMVFAGSTAQAGFTYTSAPTPITTVFGGSTATLGGVSSVSTLSIPTFINIADVSLTSTTVQPNTDLTTINFSDPISITNVPTPGTTATGIITVTGTLTFTRSDSGGEISTFTPGAFTPTATIGGVQYAISSLTYTPPTVNNTDGGGGNISALVAATVVPEPASLSIVVLSAVGCLARRRRSSI